MIKSKISIFTGIDKLFRDCHSSDVIEQYLSNINLSSQSHLLSSLVEARKAEGRSIEVVAELIGAEPEIISEIESGVYELTLGELREYALAVNAIVQFDVIPRGTREITAYLNNTKQAFYSDADWEPVDEIWDIDDSRQLHAFRENDSDCQ